MGIEAMNESEAMNRILIISKSEIKMTFISEFVVSHLRLVEFFQSQHIRTVIMKLLHTCKI